MRHRFCSARPPERVNPPLPLQILREGSISGKIILLEPRRLAARNVAQRPAELLNEKPGETVGYRMRAETCVGPSTRLEVVTEGILTRMLQNDPELTGVGLVIMMNFTSAASGPIWPLRCCSTFSRGCATTFGC